jgi:hypothetical protein
MVAVIFAVSASLRSEPVKAKIPCSFAVVRLRLSGRYLAISMPLVAKPCAGKRAIGMCDAYAEKAHENVSRMKRVGAKAPSTALCVAAGVLRRVRGVVVGGNFAQLIA